MEPFQDEGQRDYRLVLYWDPGCIEGVVEGVEAYEEYTRLVNKIFEQE